MAKKTAYSLVNGHEIRSAEDFRQLRRFLGGWFRLRDHPEYLERLAVGLQCHGLRDRLSGGDVCSFVAEFVRMEVTTGNPVSCCVYLAYIANAFARHLRANNSHEDHDREIRALYRQKAMWAEQAVRQAYEDRDDRLTVGVDMYGGAPCVTVNFVDSQRRRGGARGIGLHVPMHQAREDAPRLARFVEY